MKQEKRKSNPEKRQQLKEDLRLMNFYAAKVKKAFNQQSKKKAPA